MKTISILCMFFIALTSTNVQKEITNKAVYDGFFEGTYTFTIEGGDEFVEKTIEFDKISSSILDKYDLESEDYDGLNFSITYLIKTEKIENEDGEEDELTVYELKSLKKI